MGLLPTVPGGHTRVTVCPLNVDSQVMFLYDSLGQKSSRLLLMGTADRINTTVQFIC